MRVKNEQVETALIGLDHVVDGTGGSGGAPGYVDLARDLRDERALSDRLAEALRDVSVFVGWNGAEVRARDAADEVLAAYDKSRRTDAE